MSFVPSVYQQAIFEAMADPQGGNLQINAVAGSGKTTTIVEGLRRLPAQVASSVLLCAFNVEIRDTLLKKVKDFGLSGVTVKTNHGIGMGALFFNFSRGSQRWNPTVDSDGSKYFNLVCNYWTGKGFRAPSEGVSPAELEMVKLIHFARVTLVNPDDHEAVMEMAEAFEVEMHLPDQMLNALPVILQWGVEGMPTPDTYGRTFSAREVIDFDDMIWLPWRMGLSLKKFRMVLVDECQDLSAAQLWLVMNSLSPNGRLVAVGDPRQAIYAFAGADAASFSNITEQSGAELLPLSVCYRCPKSVIMLAQEIVPEIEAAPDAKDGAVQTLETATFLVEVTRKDMVLCRVTADLIGTAFALIRMGKPAKVRGRDIGKSLIKTLDKVEAMKGFRFSEFVEFLQEYRNRQAMVLSKKKNADTRIQLLDDRVESLMAVWENTVHNGGTSVGELRCYIDDLFADRGLGFIMLSTIHKAKGLEAERVFILRPDKLPHPMAKTPAAKEQERNLQYVAITRSLSELFFVNPETEAEIAQRLVEKKERTRVAEGILAGIREIEPAGV